MIEVVDDTAERAGLGEAADVQFVQDRASQPEAAPAGVGPAEGPVVHDPRRPADPGGLMRRPRVWSRRASVDRQRVVHPRDQSRYVRRPATPLPADQRSPAVTDENLDGRLGAGAQTENCTSDRLRALEQGNRKAGQ